MITFGRRREGETPGPTRHRPGTLAGAILATIAGGLVLAGAGGSAVHGVLAGAPDRATVDVLSVRPHDPGAFTQGLVLHDGYLYESTGRDMGEARLRKVDPRTGEVQREIHVPPSADGRHYWGEGLARVGDRLIQLTWRRETAFVYDLDTFERLGELTYEGEGWGLCYDGQRLVMSNGSDVLTFRDPETFAVTGSVAVTVDGSPLRRLNELECVNGDVYANVFLTDTIARIDPETGAVTGLIDAAGLLTPEERAQADVLNGIAHDPGTDRFLLTGKWWPKLFEVHLQWPATPETPTPTPASALLPHVLRGR